MTRKSNFALHITKPAPKTIEQQVSQSNTIYLLHLVWCFIGHLITLRNLFMKKVLNGQKWKILRKKISINANHMNFLTSNRYILFFFALKFLLYKIVLYKIQFQLKLIPNERCSAKALTSSFLSYLKSLNSRFVSTNNLSVFLISILNENNIDGLQWMLKDLIGIDSFLSTISFQDRSKVKP